MAVCKAAHDGSEHEAFESAFRAWHVAHLIGKGRKSRERIWTFDVIGKCLQEAGGKVPKHFMSSMDIRELMETTLAGSNSVDAIAMSYGSWKVLPKLERQR